jgi:hypothetical protein
MWEPRRLTTLWTSTASYRDSFTYLLTFETVFKRYWLNFVTTVKVLRYLQSTDDGSYFEAR